MGWGQGWDRSGSTGVGWGSAERSRLLGRRVWGRFGTAGPSAAPGRVPTLFAPLWAARAAPGWARRMQDRPGLRIEPGWEQEREREEGWGFLCDGSSSSLPAAAMWHSLALRRVGDVGQPGWGCEGRRLLAQGAPAALRRSLRSQHPLPSAGHSAAGPRVGPELPVGRTSRRDAGGGGGWERSCGLCPRVPSPPGAPSCWA